MRGCLTPSLRWLNVYALHAVFSTQQQEMKTMVASLMQGLMAQQQQPAQPAQPQQPQTEAEPESEPEPEPEPQ